MTEEEQLDEIRRRIDDIDDQLLALVNERARCADQVAQVKLAASADNAIFYRPEREAEILRRVIENNPGPLSGSAVKLIIREVISACLAHEKPLDVAYLGPQGTFSQDAAVLHFGNSARFQPQSSISEVFREVESGAVCYGVVPTENSSEGSVTHTLDLFMRSELRICGEVELPIHHHLLGRQKATGEIRKIVSHSQSLGQCRGWLAQNLANVPTEAVSSNAEAARLAAENPELAAVAGESAAVIYDLNKLASNIEDETHNTTRFFVLGKQSTRSTGEDKTSLMLATGNQPGALYRLLAVFDRHQLSMSRIESRPSRLARWDYVFFADIEGHIDDLPVQTAIEELRQITSTTKVLGSYPKFVSS